MCEIRLVFHLQCCDWSVANNKGRSLYSHWAATNLCHYYSQTTQIPISHWQENFVGSCLFIHIFLFQLKVQHLDKSFKGHWNHLKANLRSGKMCGGWAEDRAALFFLVPEKVTFGGIWCCHPLTVVFVDLCPASLISWSCDSSRYRCTIHCAECEVNTNSIDLTSPSTRLLLRLFPVKQQAGDMMRPLQDKVVLWRCCCSCPVVTKTQGFIPTNESWARAWVAAVTSSFSPSAPSAPKSIHAG